MAKRPSQERTRRFPQRTCLACRQVRAKRDLIRVVRTSEGGIYIDLTGRKPGRGAYLCSNTKCWQMGVASRRIEHSLLASLSPEQRDNLMKIGQDITEENKWSDLESMQNK